jgi:potassium efflux system protein
VRRLPSVSTRYALIVALAAVSSAVFSARYVCAQSQGDTVITGEGKQPEQVSNGGRAVIDVAVLNDKLAAIKASTELDDATKAGLAGIYGEAIRFAGERDGYLQKAGTYAAFVKSGVRRRLEEIKRESAELEQPHPEEIRARAQEMSLEEVQHAVSEETSRLHEINSEMETIEQKFQTLRTRRGSIASELNGIKKELKRAGTPEPAATGTTVSGRHEEALRDRAEVRREMLEARAKALRQEELYIPLMLNVLTAERDLYETQAKQAGQLDRAWQEALAAKREERLRERVLAARAVCERAKAEGWPPSLTQLAAKGVVYAKVLNSIEENIREVKEHVAQLKEWLAKVQGDYELTAKRIKTVGLTPTTGLFFVRKRRELARMAFPTQASEQRKSEMRKVTEYELLFEDVRGTLGRIDSARLRAAVEASPLPAGQRRHVIAGGEELLRQTRQVVNELGTALPEYSALLADEAYSERALKLEISVYRRFLNNCLFWVQSNQPMSMADIAMLPAACCRLFLPSNWLGVGRACVRSIKNYPARWVILLLLLGVWIYVYSLAGKRFRGMKRKGTDGAKGSVIGLIVALILTVVRSAGVPLVLLLVSRQLWMVPEGGLFTRGVCAALDITAKLIFCGWFAVELFREGGAGRMCFGWPPAVCRMVESSVRRFLVTIVPLVFFMTIVNNGLSIAERVSLGRVLFVVTVLATGYILSRVFRPESPLFSLRFFAGEKMFHLFFKKSLYTLTLVLSVILVCGAFYGYYYSSIAISVGLLKTLGFALVLVIVYCTVLYRNTAAREETAGKESESREGGPYHVAGRLVTVLLILGGLYRIWGQELPVLQALNEVILWTYQIGLGATQQPILKSVTLGNLILFILILWITNLIVKNMTGVLEAVLGKRRSMDRGNRHAVILLSRYAVVLIGITLAMNSIGIGWGKVQWLIAALTVGLGFGLQDIVANFVSGIIILFEKPIRIGDTVTIGDTSGRVTRIQIRSTTITDWDRHEIIVPNKTFLTDKITNWSLSDAIIRIMVDVGIAYGSDTKKAEAMLVKIAGESPLVLDAPPPNVYFLGFGDSSLDLRLHAYVHARDRLRAPHQLRMAINEAFNRAAIEIPFPQRDVHLDAVKPIQVRMMSPEAKGDGGQNV